MSTVVRAGLDGCSLHVQIFKPVGELAGRYYTVKDLAARWCCHPQTVRMWMLRMRRAGRGPTREQARLHKRNRARRYTLVRDDYAGLMRAIFMDGTIKL